MAIEKVIEIKLSAREAEKNLEGINKTLEEQREILILLEKELLDVQDAQNKTSKTNLAAQKQLTTQSNHLKSAIKDQKLGLKSLNIERREAADVLADLNKGSKDNTNIIRGIDKLTGGYATKVLKLKKALFSSIKVVKGFVAGLSGVKKALIATGIGALVVGLGLVVAYWEDIIALFDDGSKKLQKQADEHRKNISLNKNQLDLLNNQEKILKLQGKSTKEIVEQKKKVLVLQQEENRLLLENLKTQLLREQQQQTELSFWEKTKVAVANAVGGVGAAAVINAKTFKKTTEEIEKLDEIEKQIQETKLNGQKLTLSLLEIDEKSNKKKIKDAKEIENLEKKADQEELEAEKEKAAALERIRKGLIDTEAEERAERLREIKADYDEQIKLAELYYGLESDKVKELRAAQRLALQDQQTEFDEEDKEKAEKKSQEAADKLALDKETEAMSFEEQRLLIDKRKKLLNEDETINDEDRLELKKQFNEAEAELDRQKIADKKAVVDAISQFADAESGIGKALLLIKQGLALEETIMDLKRITFKGVEAVGSAGVSTAQNVAESSKIGFPQNIITISSAIAQGVGIISSVKKAVSKTKAKAGASASASVPSISTPSIPTSLPPSFNVVGATETSVLSDAVAGQTNQPVQAYVVANDVTTAQSLENNIVEGATI